jgi:hypothetical protein
VAENDSTSLILPKSKAALARQSAVRNSLAKVPFEKVPFEAVVVRHKTEEERGADGALTWGEGMCGIQHTHGGELYRKASVFRVSEWLGDKPEVTTLLEECMSRIVEDSDETDDDDDDKAAGEEEGTTTTTTTTTTHGSMKLKLDRRVSTATTLATATVNGFTRRHSVRSTPLPAPANDDGILEGGRRVAVASAASSSPPPKKKVGVNSKSALETSYPGASTGKDGKGKRASTSSGDGGGGGGGGGHPETFKFDTINPLEGFSPNTEDVSASSSSASSSRVVVTTPVETGATATSTPPPPPPPPPPPQDVRFDQFYTNSKNDITKAKARDFRSVAKVPPMVALQSSSSSSSSLSSSSSSSSPHASLHASSEVVPAEGKHLSRAKSNSLLAANREIEDWHETQDRRFREWLCKQKPHSLLGLRPEEVSCTPAH